MNIEEKNHWKEEEVKKERIFTSNVCLCMGEKSWFSEISKQQQQQKKVTRIENNCLSKSSSDSGIHCMVQHQIANG